MKQSSIGQRNGTIDIIKFVSCLFIVMYHFFFYTSGERFFKGGKFGVEVFCIISGAFFYKKYLKEKDTITVWGYIKQRYLRFLPYTTASFFLMYFLLPHHKRGLVETLDQFSEYIWEILLVNMTGINQGKAPLNSPTWTIGCLLIVECVILGLLICNEKRFLNWILPVSMISIYGVWANSDVNYRTWLGFVNFGVLQVWCAVSWGILAVIASNQLRHKWKQPSKVLTVIELLCYLGVFLVMVYRSTFYYGLLVTLFSFFAVSITFSQRSYSFLLRDSRFTRLLGRLSLAIYLNHSLLLKLFQNHFGADKMLETLPLFLVVLILLALLFDFAMEKIIGKVRSWKG